LIVPKRVNIPNHHADPPKISLESRKTPAKNPQIP
jgi:hypothetical protein